MKQRLFLFGLVFALFSCVFVQASDVPKEFEQKLKTRYEHQKMAIVPAKVMAAIITNMNLGYPVNYDHFYNTVPIPKSYERRNRLDERTTEEVQLVSGRVETLRTGELLNVSEIKTVRRSGFYGVDIFLSAHGKELGVNAAQEKEYGVHFRFAFAPEIVERGDYDTVVAEINKYLLPPAEYKQASEAQTKVDIQPGMSKEDVIKALGEPQKTITFGKKTILKYQDLTIELEESKVVEVKAN